LGPRNLTISAIDISLDPAPINADWILEGNPQARNKVVFKSEDGTAWTMVWECTAGRFNWFYACDETVHVVEGDVILTTAAGTIRLSAGSSFFFPAGHWATWQVDSYVRKVAFLRHTLPRPAGAVLRGWKRIAERPVMQPMKAPVRRGLAEISIALAWLLSLLFALFAMPEFG
jgi:uncharacterized cupin superfamily protein